MRSNLFILELLYIYNIQMYIEAYKSIEYVFLA